jgi:hypothetical protein
MAIDNNALVESDGTQLPLQPLEGGHWLPPTLQIDFAEHDPTTMFSEASSTIPNNSVSQQRIIQQAIESNHTENQIGGAVCTQTKNETQNSDSSIPWSAYKDAQKDLHEVSRSQRKDSRSLPPTQMRSEPNERSQTLGVSTRPSQTPRRASHADAAFDGANSTFQMEEPSQRSRRTKTTTPSQQANPFHPPVSFLSEIEVQDQSPLKPRRRTEESMSATKPRRRKTSEKPEALEPTSDELWVAAAQEQYKPRTSRSRSSKITDDEYLQAVQQTLKPKSKRKKMVTATTEASEPELQQNIAGAPKASKKGVEVTTETRGAYETEEYFGGEDKENQAPGTMSPPDSAKAPAPPSRPVLVEVAIPPPATANMKAKVSVQTDESSFTKGLATASPVVQITQQASSSASTKRKTKARRSQTAATPGFSQRRKVFDSDDEDSEISPIKSDAAERDELALSPAVKQKIEVMAPPPLPQSVPEVKKKKKGRPRKNDNGNVASTASNERVSVTSKTADYVMDVPIDMPIDMPIEDGVPLADEQMDVNHNENDTTILVSADPPKKPKPSKATEEKKSAPPQSTPEQPQLAPAPEVPKTPESKTKAKSPTNHSPINKGKVPYRVGLSRRSRIAPLLRIIKK